MTDLACRQSIAELLLNHYSVWGIIRHATFNAFKISFWQTNLFRDLQNIIKWQWTKEQLHYLENQIDLVKQSLKFNGNTLVMTQFIGSIIILFYIGAFLPSSVNTWFEFDWNWNSVIMCLTINGLYLSHPSPTPHHYYIYYII